MARLVQTLCLFFLFFVYSSSITAESIILKTGEEIEYQNIFSLSDEGVTLQVSNGISFHSWEEIDEKTAQNMSETHYTAFLKQKDSQKIASEKAANKKKKQVNKSPGKETQSFDFTETFDQLKQAVNEIAPESSPALADQPAISRKNPRAEHYEKRLKKELSKKLKTAYVTVFFRKGVTKHALSILVDTLHQDSYTIGTDLRLKKTDTITVYIEPSTIRITPKGAIACYVHDLRALFIPEILLKKPVSYYYNVLVHELAHGLVDQCGPERLPTWLEEGIARYYENKQTFTRKNWDILNYLLRKNKLPSLQKLTTFPQLSQQEQIAIAYLYSYAAVTVLIQEIGKRKFFSLVRSLKKGAAYPVIFDKIAGRSISSFDTTLKNMIKNSGWKTRKRF